MTRSSAERRASVRSVSPADEGRQRGVSLTAGLGTDVLLPADERLFCRCGGEVRIVPLIPGYVTLGHVRNPRHGHHLVRLAPGGAQGPGLGRRPEGPVGSSPVRPLTTAPASEAGLTPAAPRVGNAAGRRRSTRRRVSPASAA